MSENKDIEIAFKDFIREFVIKSKQERILQFLNKEKNWWKINIEFHTSRHFKKSALKDIKPNDQYSNIIFEDLKKMGVENECYSFLDYLNNRKYKWKLSEKLDDSVGYLIETIIYCPKSKIGYFEGGHAKDRFILKN